MKYHTLYVLPNQHIADEWNKYLPPSQHAVSYRNMAGQRAFVAIVLRFVAGMSSEKFQQARIDAQAVGDVVLDW